MIIFIYFGAAKVHHSSATGVDSPWIKKGSTKKYLRGGYTKGRGDIGKIKGSQGLSKGLAEQCRKIGT